MRFREDWNGGKNKLDWLRDSADATPGRTALGRVEIERLFGARQPLVAPNWRAMRPCSKVLQRDQMPEDQRTLFDMLFAPGDEEQDMPLSQGYQGRAHIGSAAMLASLDKDVGGFNRRLTELIKMAKQDQDVRIFLVGSVFGGTGAAGFPTLARAVNQIRTGGDDAAGRENVRVAGALMLPSNT